MLQALGIASPLPMVAIDLRGNVTMWNSAAEQVFGWTASQVLGRFLPIVPPENLGHFAELNQRLLQGQVMVNVEAPCLRADGSRIQVSLALAGLNDAQGRPRGFMAVLSDITEQARRRMELERAREEAEAAVRARDQFLATVSHELRTPLQPILMAAAARERDPRLPPDVREDLAMVQRNAAVEARLISDLLDLTRITHGKVELSCESVDVHEILGYAIKNCQEPLLAKRQELSVRWLARERFIHGDPARLQQIFWNLLTNALKFTSEGGRIEVTARNEEQGNCRLEDSDSPVGWAYSPTNSSPVGAASTDRRELPIADCRLPIAKAQSLQSKAAADSEQGTTLSTQNSELSTPLTPDPSPLTPSLIIEIRDTGIGIEPESLPRIFNAFEQGDKAITRQFGGLGLGLTICKTLVELHGGQIRAASEGIGKGATFTIKLPTCPAPLAEPAAAPAAPGVETAKSLEPAKAISQKLKILLVEDHLDTLRIMAQLLRGYDHDVKTANTIQTALDAAAAEPFDLLISDLGLPDGSGLDLMRQLKARYGLPGLALSGYGQDSDRRQSREAGFIDLLVKPVNLGHLERTIQRIGASRREAGNVSA